MLHSRRKHQATSLRIPRDISLAKEQHPCHGAFIMNHAIRCSAVVFSVLTSQLLCAQNTSPTQPQQPAQQKTTDDTNTPTRFWQASVGGGHYMVALDRISAISRHRYVLDGALIVDEVNVDALGQALVRFYFITPITEEMSGNGVAGAAVRAVDRGKELLDRTASRAGTDVQNMVVKKYPDTTHSKTVEFRVQTAQQLTELYQSVRTAWESGRGRKFSAP